MARRPLARKRLSVDSRVQSVVAAAAPLVSRLPSLIEPLETRALLSGTLVSVAMAGNSNTGVTGTVYADMDRNGVRNNGENGLAGWTVYIDLDQSGTLNTDAAGVIEPSVVTNKDGDYGISRLVPGTYRVVEIVATGWDATAPASVDTTVVNNSIKTVNFFNFAGGSVVGTLWNDQNEDGVRATAPGGGFTEPAIPGWTVFLDLDKDGLQTAGEPSTTSAADGSYLFSDLPEGDYEVTVLMPGTWEPTKGHDSKQTAAVTPLGTFTQDFAFFSLTDGSITGTVWNDLNGDGDRNVNLATGEFTEPGLTDWTVFVDTNLDGIAGATEPTATTDAAGDYTFPSLPAGTHVVREVLPSGWSAAPGYGVSQSVIVRAGETEKDIDFANFTVLNGAIRGSVWNDVNRNGSRDTSLAGVYTEPGLSGWQVYLDLNRNKLLDAEEPVATTGTDGGYNFADLQVGEYEIREIVPSGWEPTIGYSDSYNVRVISGVEVVAHDIGNFSLSTVAPGTIVGTVWNDINGNGVRESAGGVATDVGLAGWKVFVDSNSNGVLDAAEPQATTDADGVYTISNVQPGTIAVRVVTQAGWRSTAPSTGLRSITLRNAGNLTGLDFGQEAVKNSTIRGSVYADKSANGVREAAEQGLGGIAVYLDLNLNGSADAGEPTTTTSYDLYYTPAINETGQYEFAHLASGTYSVRIVVPDVLSATPGDQRVKTVVMSATEDHTGVDFAARYRLTEVRGVKFDDVNGNETRDPGEPAEADATIYIDLDRDGTHDAGEPITTTGPDGSYSFSGLDPDSYIVREKVRADRTATYPRTKGGILWPSGISNPVVGNVSPRDITVSLAKNQSHRQSVSLTLPNVGALTNKVDVFLLFDDTGSFVNNSPIVRSAFPTIISQLQAALPGIDLGFGVGRFEEYANFASEYATGRPFILNQPIVATSTPGYMAAIQAALNRTTPGYGGDQPETDIEALYQLVSGAGFDGNNNGSVLDSGPAGLASTQLNPGASGDVPSFASFKPDAAGGVLPGDGSIGGAGFRAGALPIVLVATDTGFAFQPIGATTITGAGGVTLPMSALTGTSRPTTPFGNGASIQQAITGLNALGALVIGLGTNPQANIDPRQGLESLSALTGAVNRSTTTIANGTADPIAPGDPLYFQIASGFGASVSSGVVTAIQNGVTNVAVDVTLQASDPRVRIINHSGVQKSIGSGQTATFDVEIIGDGAPRRFDLQFVRAGTNVVLGSIPVVLGTPVTGDCYDYTELEDGEIEIEVDFGTKSSAPPVLGTPTISLAPATFTFDGKSHALVPAATGSDGTTVPGTFVVTYNGAATAPSTAGVYSVVANFTSGNPAYGNASATTTLTITKAAPTVNATGGVWAYDGTAHAASATATGVDGAPVSGAFNFTYNGVATVPTTAGVYSVIAGFVSADANYADASATATLTITQAAATVNVNSSLYTYDAVPHAATASATGTDGKPVSGTISYTYNGSSVVPVGAGVYAVEASFTSADPSYGSAIGRGTLTILAATPTLTTTGGSFTYDALPHEASAAAAGIGGAAVPGIYRFTYNGQPTTPTNAGVYNVVATFESADANYANVNGSATLTIGVATPSVVVAGGVFIYDATSHAASATASGVGGVAVPGSFTYTYNEGPTPPTDAGTYTVIARFTTTDVNYASATGTGVLTINKAAASFALPNPVSIDVGTTSVTLQGRLSAGTLIPVGDQVVVTLNGVSQTAIVGSDGLFESVFAASGLTAGSYDYSFRHAPTGVNFATAADASATLTVRAVTSGITATGQAISAIAGAPASRTVALITNSTGNPADYLATIDWGDGTTSEGQVSGTSSTLAVAGLHTYAIAGTATIRVTISLRSSPAASVVTTSTASVTRLTLPATKTREAEFWAKSGQQLIKSFNGSPGSTALGNWLAETMPNLYGPDAGLANMKGRTNSSIAAYFLSLWKRLEKSVATEVFAAALNVYATTDLLGGAQGVRHGFTSTATGLGARSFNVRNDGAAVGVPNRSSVTVYQMLRGVDSLSVKGVFYGGNRSLQRHGEDLFGDLNSI